MAHAIQVKNTFVDVVDDCSEHSLAPEANKRSNSLPRSWKPAGPKNGPKTRMLWSDVMSDSGDSTEAPDGSSIDEGNQSWVEQAESTRGHEHQLDELPVPEASPQRRPESRSEWARTPLKAVKVRGAKPYIKQPASTDFVIGLLRYFLCSSMCVGDVTVEDKEESSGRKICLTVELRSDALPSSGKVEDWILEPARQALLAACMDSDNVYVMGYAMQPYKNFHDLGFKCVLGVAADSDTVCWDTYQFGTCPCGSSCRLSHPHRANLTDLTVQVKVS